MVKKLKYRLEYFVLRGFAALLNALPYRMALALAWGASSFLFHVVRLRRRETLDRIRFVLGPQTPHRELKRVARLSLRNMSFNIVEMMRAPSINKAWIDQHMPTFGPRIPIAIDLIQKHRGLIFAVPHMGNWDLAGWACNRYGITMFSIGARQRNPYINAWITRQRENGITMLERGGKTLKEIIIRLQEGSAFAILPDVRMPKKDITVAFLNGEANLGRGMAAFARSANVPILPAVFMRTGWTQHDFVYFDPIFPDLTLDKETDIQRMTNRVMQYIDAAIRNHPEQWFWYNGRWILDPVKP